MKLKAPFKFVSMTVSQSSIDMRMLSPSRVTPALLIRISTRPKSSKMRALVCCTAAVVSDIDRIGFRGVGMAGVDLIGGPLCIRLAATDGGDPGSFVSQTHRDGMTDPPPRSCHDCDLIFESHHTPS